MMITHRVLYSKSSVLIDASVVEYILYYCYIYSYAPNLQCLMKLKIITNIFRIFDPTNILNISP